MAKLPPIRESFYLAAPPARVYAALTQPKWLTRWFVDRAVLTPKEGEEFELVWPGGYTMHGRVNEAASGRKLGLDWIDRFEEGRTFATRVRFELRKKGRGTLLNVTHRGFKSGKRWVLLYASIRAGWAYYLLNLKSVLEHGNDLRSDADSVVG